MKQGVSTYIFSLTILNDMHRMQFLPQFVKMSLKRFRFVITRGNLVKKHVSFRSKYMIIKIFYVFSGALSTHSSDLNITHFYIHASIEFSFPLLYDNVSRDNWSSNTLPIEQHVNKMQQF